MIRGRELKGLHQNKRSAAGLEAWALWQAPEHSVNSLCKVLLVIPLLRSEPKEAPWLGIYRDKMNVKILLLEQNKSKFIHRFENFHLTL